MADLSEMNQALRNVESLLDVAQQQATEAVRLALRNGMTITAGVVKDVREHITDAHALLEAMD